MLRHLLLALSLVSLIIHLSVKIDAFAYNPTSQLPSMPESHGENTYHTYQQAAVESPIRSVLYHTEHVPRLYENYGRQARFPVYRPRVQYVQQIIAPRKLRPSKPWIRQLHSFKRNRGNYLPQVFVREKGMGINQKHSKMSNYQPRYSNKRIFPQRQKPLTFITEETMPYQATYSPIRKQAFVPHEVVRTNYHTNTRSKIVTNYPEKYSVEEATSQSSQTLPLESKIASKYSPIVPGGNVPKHSAEWLYGRSKTIPKLVNLLDKEDTQDATTKTTNVKTRQYLSSIPDELVSSYTAKWPYGSKDEGISYQEIDGGINALPGYSDGEKDI